MAANDGDGTGLSVQEGWFRFGVYLAFLYAAFTAVVFYLLRVDQTIGMVVAVAVSIVFGIAIMVYVLYVR